MYEGGQIILNLGLIALSLWLIFKKNASKTSKIVGVILLVLVVLGALSPFLSDGSIN